MRTVAYHVFDVPNLNEEISSFTARTSLQKHSWKRGASIERNLLFSSEVSVMVALVAHFLWIPKLVLNPHRTFPPVAHIQRLSDELDPSVRVPAATTYSSTLRLPSH